MGDSYWAAAVQMTSGEDKERNLETAERLVREAAERGARLVALPELFNCLGRKEQVIRAAEPVPGPTSQRMGDLARHLRITLLAGSICERAEGRDRVFNTSLLFDDSGTLLARYCKIHLFDVNLPGRVCYQESSWIAPGREVVSADTDHGRLGLSICYDLRFPELYRQLVRQDCRIILVPSAFSLPTGRDHWEVLLRSRAIENQAYVVAPNQWGQHTPGFATCGRSAIIDPWGVALAVAPDGEGVILARLDARRQETIRRELPALSHRRLDPDGPIRPR